MTYLNKVLRQFYFKVSVEVYAKLVSNEQRVFDYEVYRMLLDGVAFNDGEQKGRMVVFSHDGADLGTVNRKTVTDVVCILKRNGQIKRGGYIHNPTNEITLAWEGPP